jgi:GNAT superfamily N-acetyltransferase
MTIAIDGPSALPPGDAPARTDTQAASSCIWRWIPIRSLAPRHRPRILAHLQALSPADRHLRFGHSASDTQIGRYVDHIDFDRDEVFGVFNRRLQVIALAHLAYLGPDRHHPTAAEFGVSVNPSARGHGVGARLFDHAVLRARNQGVNTLVIHALSENAAMLHIVRRAGARVERDGPDSTASLGLEAEDFNSHIEALAERQAAEFDYGVKVQVRRVGALMRMITPWQAGV